MGVKISDLSPKGSKIASTDLIEVAVVSGGGYVSRSVTGSQINEVSLDTTPQLGGDLDVNGQAITSSVNGNVIITPNGTGHIAVGFGSTNNPPIRFYESSANGTNSIGIKAPATLTADSTTIKRKYRELSKIYHPDKNPQGEDMFKKISNAYG